MVIYMKVCILSMQRVLNYGSLLQAYSLKKMITSLGHKVSFIDIEPNEEDNHKRLEVKSFDEGVELSGKNIIYRLLQQDAIIFYGLKKIIAKKNVGRLQKSFADKVLELDEKNNEKEYDVCVIGSDEVFNCLNDESWGFTSQLFGNVRQANKVITYAASCGFTKPSDLADGMRDVISNSFSLVSAFSVRDENTASFVREIAKTEPQYHLDPVVVGNFDDEIERASKCLKKLPEKYCVIYSYHGRMGFPEKEVILDLCHKENMIPVSIGGAQKWVHTHLELDPFEVLCAFKNAAYVVTDTFHGAIFSAKYASRYAIIIRDSNRNKLSDLISRLKIDRHRVTSIEQIVDLYTVLDNKETIRDIENIQYERSIEYLEQNI